MKILIVEDDADLRELTSRAMRKERYLVETAGTCAEAEMKMMIYDYDCILLDLMLPDGSGLNLLRRLRREGRRTNVIILSARDSIDDKVEGLEQGADDYLPKPFHLSELQARVKSVIRRNTHGGEQTIEVGNVSISPFDYSVSVQGTPLALNRKEYDILHFFATRPGRTVSKETLAEAVWGEMADASDNYDYVYAQMKNLRRHLKEGGADIELKTVYGYGYKLELP